MISDKDILEVAEMFRVEKERHEETVYQIMKLFANKPARIVIPWTKNTNVFVPGYLRPCQAQRIFSIYEHDFNAQDIFDVTIDHGVTVIYLKRGVAELK